MDFSAPQDPAMQEFREQVRAWLKTRIPPEVQAAPEKGASDLVTQEWARQFQRELAERGWAAPAWPCGYGGGGLTLLHDGVVREELDSWSIPPLYEANRQVAAAILAWGHEEQRQRFIPPLLRGDVTAWRMLAEGDALVDPGSVGIQVAKDGDFYVVSGEKTFWGNLGQPTYLWTLAVTDVDAPARRRLSAFLIPADLPGIAVTELETLVGRGQHSVVLDGVRVPRTYLIGEEGDGWLVAERALETAEAADRDLSDHQRLISKLIQHSRETLRESGPASQNQRRQQLIAEAYIDSQVLRLLALRNRWMNSRGRAITYQRAQYALVAKIMRQRLASTFLEVLGPFALLNDRRWAPMHGEGEALQRTSLPDVDPNDSIAMHSHLIGSCLGLTQTL